MTGEELEYKYWKYYLMLEKRFIESLEYVELHQDNFDTFSNGYAFLLQAIGAELDTFFKVFCGFDTEEQKTMKDYAEYVLKKNPDIVDQVIVLPEYKIAIRPFEDWDSKPLHWWGAFTDIKHNRYDKRALATLENVLNMLGALYILELMYLKEITKSELIDIFEEDSKLFIMLNWYTRAIRYGNGHYAVKTGPRNPDGSQGIQLMRKTPNFHVKNLEVIKD